MNGKVITLAHGGGGRLQNELIAEEIVPRFGTGALRGLPDAARVPGGEELLVTTDSFVVTPRFFPGGDIGKLAVIGTVNDLLVAGGIPRYLTLSLILEDGFSREELGRILDSVKATALECGVEIVTGDTKVVPRGAADGIYLNTAGIGVRNPALELGRSRFKAGDRLLVSGGVGEHGFTILAARHGIATPGLKSDCAPLTDVVAAALAVAGNSIEFMRDATRGGVGGVISEIIGDAFDARLDGEALPRSGAVRTLEKMFGIESWFSACEGRLVMVADAAGAGAVLEAWRKLECGRLAADLGEIVPGDGRMIVSGEWGGGRLLTLPSGEQMPRIC